MKYLLMIVALLFATNANAQTPDNVAQIENYLNNLSNMSAKFVQNASNGNMAEGTLKISKPNKIRMEYGAPTDVLIVGDGNFIVYHDKELDQTTHIDYDDIPASLILANDVKIDNKKLKIKDFYQDAGTTSIEIEHANNPDVGPIKLLFSNSPFALKQWSIVDPQGIEVVVSLFDVDDNASFEDETFEFSENKKKPKYKK